MLDLLQRRSRLAPGGASRACRAPRIDALLPGVGDLRIGGFRLVPGGLGAAPVPGEHAVGFHRGVENVQAVFQRRLGFGIGIGRGAASGDSIPFLFRYTATTSFHTTFVYDRARDSWQWHMDNDSAGVLQPFARVTLTRR